MGTQPPTLWTIGHSTRTLDDFLGLLVRHEITALVDVRRFAASRKYPHFNHDALDTSLARAGIEYVPLPALGRRPTAATPSGATPRFAAMPITWRLRNFTRPSRASRSSPGTRGRR